LNSEDKNIILQIFGKDSFDKSDNQLTFQFISNPDGSVRWLFPKTLKEPTFLSFYNTSSLFSKLLANTIRLLFFFRMQKLIINGEINIRIEKNSLLDIVLSENTFENYSIFMGTKGENRKAIVELNRNYKTSIFAKLGLTKNSINLVKKEIDNLTFLNSKNISKLVVPKILYSNREAGIIGLENIRPRKYTQKIKLDAAHYNALEELANIKSEQQRWKDIKLLDKCKSNINSLENVEHSNNGIDIEKKENLKKNLYAISDMLSTDDYVQTALSHCDFTPWNMYVKDNEVFLLDWELSRFDVPLLYDFFHYIFQSSILIKKNSFAEIISDIKIALEHKQMKEFVRAYQVDLNKNYCFYLLYTVSYYLRKFVVQDDLHTQANWLINTWDEAINDAIKLNGKIF